MFTTVRRLMIDAHRFVLKDIGLIGNKSLVFYLVWADFYGGSLFWSVYGFVNVAQLASPTYLI